MRKSAVMISGGAAVLFALIVGFGFRSQCGAPRRSSFSLSSIKSHKQVVDVLIIGSGPAGLSAALYTARSRMHTLIIAGDKPGGQLTETTYVENWPGSEKQLGRSIMSSLENQARRFGAEILQDSVVGADFSKWPYTVQTEDGHTINALSVIITTGAHSVTLGIPGEKEYWGRGVAVCAICDAPFYKKKDAIVIGGGDSAIEKALQLAAFARHVTILVRKTSMRAAPVMQERLDKISGKIDVLYNYDVQRIIGDGDQVTGVEVRNNKTGEVKTLETDGVFLAIGHKPNTDLFKGQLPMTPQGHIHVQGRSQATLVPGVFAAGEVEDDVYRQAGVAAGDGIKAGLDAVNFLNEIGLNQQFADELDNRGVYFDAFESEPDALTLLSSMSEFAKHVEGMSKGIAVVDFYAEYCPSCMMMLPIFSSVSKRYSDDVHFFKVDADQAKDIVRYLNVPKVPALLLYKDGKLVAKEMKTMSRQELSQWINSYLAS
ncbi:FAD-dependent oxidoreductase [Candidatus Babeliales bacterium]|nr:FAD-dependent oxidoreductase [Candidatus Babeliales bacterium]